MPKGQPCNLIGQKFNRLKILRRSNKYSLWECICDCGKIIYAGSTALMQNKTKSCGCYQRSLDKSNNNKKHGQSNNLTYVSWSAMKNRGLGKTWKNRYFDRGITICKEWHSFEKFFDDMGSRPSKDHSIERIDNNKGYYKENCKWATREEQQNNRERTIFLEVNNRIISASNACRLFSLSQLEFYNRRRRKQYSYQEAFNELILEKGLTFNY